MVDLRVRFVAAPFPTTNSMDVTWLFDIDRNPSTTNENLAPPQGIDLVLNAEGVGGIKVQAGGIGGSRVPVAILSHGGFDAVADVDQSTLQFGWTGQEPSIVGCDANPIDVDGDGLMDLVCDFSVKKMGFQAGDTLGVLKGRLYDTTPFRGSDSVTITGTQH